MDTTHGFTAVLAVSMTKGLRFLWPGREDLSFTYFKFWHSEPGFHWPTTKFNTKLQQVWLELLNLPSKIYANWLRDVRLWVTCNYVEYAGMGEPTSWISNSKVWKSCLIINRLTVSFLNPTALTPSPSNFSLWVCLLFIAVELEVDHRSRPVCTLARGNCSHKIDLWCVTSHSSSNTHNHIHLFFWHKIQQ